MSIFKKKQLKNTVKQRYGQDCGVACLAMFFGISYEEAEYRTSQALKRKTPILWMNNIDLAKVIAIGTHSPIQLLTILKDVPAILSVPSLMTKKKFHYIYWDGKEIHDPSNYECYTTSDFKNDLPMADPVACAYRIGVDLPSHLYSEFDWEFINETSIT